jgi:hypothetical protein
VVVDVDNSSVAGTNHISDRDPHVPTTVVTNPRYAQVGRRQ